LTPKAKPSAQIRLKVDAAFGRNLSNAVRRPASTCMTGISLGGPRDDKTRVGKPVPLSSANVSALELRPLSEVAPAREAAVVLKSPSRSGFQKWHGSPDP